MPWKKLTPERQSAQTVTIRKDGISLSGAFISSNNLSEYGWIELFVDTSLRRVGFKFQRNPTGSTMKLTMESMHGRLIPTRSTTDFDWIRDLLQRPTHERRFLVATDESVEDPTQGVRYFVFLGYCFKPQRDFVKKADYPRLPAVYRLFKDGELVRIGETGNLEDRLKDHFQEYGDKVDFYDFAEIHDASARKQEERRLLSEFKDAHGSLPKYNPVTA